MRPDWFACKTCLFSSDRPLWGFPVRNSWTCNLQNIEQPVSPYGYCNKWVCEKCWCPWDSCTYPKDQDEDDFSGIYDNHHICLPVRIKE